MINCFTLLTLEAFQQCYLTRLLDVFGYVTTSFVLNVSMLHRRAAAGEGVRMEKFTKGTRWRRVSNVNRSCHWNKPGGGSHHYIFFFKNF